MAAPQVKPTKRSVRQIVPLNGGPPKATVTSNVWVATPQVFSRPEEGNAIRSFITGEDYFADLIASLDAASSEVYIAGWQINWDALLAEGVRLYDVVYRNAKRGVKFYVMPWKHADPVQTYDGASVKVFNSINTRLRRRTEDQREARVHRPGRFAGKRQCRVLQPSPKAGRRRSQDRLHRRHRPGLRTLRRRKLRPSTPPPRGARR